MNEPKLGELITCDAQRDAIHIAIAPVTSAMFLRPGEDVCFCDDGRAQLAHKTSKPAIGIVDPFLTQPVKEGERFWLFLYPRTITSLRHDWTHPAFQQATALVSDVRDVWFDAFAAKCRMTTDLLFDAAKQFSEFGEGMHMGQNESYKNPTSEEWKEFWMRYNQKFGAKVDTDSYAPFSCSC